MKCKSTTMTMIALGVLVLGGCNEKPADVSRTAAGSSEAKIAQVATLDAALDPTHLKVFLTVVDQPRALNNGAAIAFSVRIENKGTETLSPVGKFPVSMGIQLADKDGKVIARDFMRHKIPVIEAGGTEIIPIELPAEQLLGHTVVVELVQEGVNWFSDIGQPGVVVGPFSACVDTPKLFCSGNTAAN